MVMSSATDLQMRQQFRNLGARLAAARELERRAQQLGRAFDEGEALAFDEFVGDVLAVVLLQRRLRIEQIDLRRRARHEQVNDALRLGGEHGRFGAESLAFRARSKPG